MHHTFDVAIATRFGIAEAVFIENMRFWLLKNETENRNIHKGRAWTYNSAKAFARLFPYLSATQIHRITTKLEEEGVLLVDNFNSNTYDRTKWYSLSDEMLFADLQNGACKSAKSLNTYINTNTSGEFIKEEKPTTPNAFDLFWAAYPKRIAKDDAKKAFAKRKVTSALLEKMLSAIAKWKNTEQWKKDGGQFIPNPASWLNAGRWEDEIVAVSTQSYSMTGVL
jgi:hypothetical protein